MKLVLKFLSGFTWRLGNLNECLVALWSLITFYSKRDLTMTLDYKHYKMINLYKCWLLFIKNYNVFDCLILIGQKELIKFICICNCFYSNNLQSILHCNVVTSNFSIILRSLQCQCLVTVKGKAVSCHFFMTGMFCGFKQRTSKEIKLVNPNQ